MDRRKAIAAAGAISLVAAATVVALGSGLGLFGLDGRGSNVGNLSPIDATHQVSHRAGDDSVTTSSTVPDPLTTVSTAPNHDANDDHGGGARGPGSGRSGSDDRGPGSWGSGHDDD
jgi:hypothetical protein